MVTFEALAALVDYPGRDFADAVEECATRVAVPGAAEALRAAAGAARAMLSGRLEELYAQTFDFRADTSLYIGHHMFGEDLRRSLFMARLRQSYEEAGLENSTELPDHLALMLRYLARRPPEDEARDLLEVCLIPALTAILRALEGKEGPYPEIVRGILLCLAEARASEAEEQPCCQPLRSSSSPTLP